MAVWIISHSSVNTESGYGLFPPRRRAISLNPCCLFGNSTYFIEIFIKIQHLLSRKCIWKYRLWNGDLNIPQCFNTISKRFLIFVPVYLLVTINNPTEHLIRLLGSLHCSNTFYSRAHSFSKILAYRLNGCYHCINHINIHQLLCTQTSERRCSTEKNYDIHLFVFLKNANVVIEVR